MYYFIINFLDFQRNVNRIQFKEIIILTTCYSKKRFTRSLVAIELCWTSIVLTINMCFVQYLYEKLQFFYNRIQNHVQGTVVQRISCRDKAFQEHRPWNHCLSGNNRIRKIVQGTMVHGRRVMSQSLRDETDVYIKCFFNFSIYEYVSSYINVL